MSVFDDFLEAIEQNKLMGGLVLDVGCGKHKRGNIGVDYSRDSCADVIADANHLPFRAGVFVKVISFCCLEHSPNPLQFLKEQHRVLSEAGGIFCVTDNAQYYRWSVQRFAGLSHPDMLQDHYLIFFPENVLRLMNLAGFKKLNWSFITTPPIFFDVIALFLIKIHFWREASLFKRFVVIGTK